MFGQQQWFKYTGGPVTYNGHICTSGLCEATYNKSLFSEAHAVLFHARDMPNVTELEVLNRVRPVSQLWCYFNMENPLNSNSTHEISRFFNVTLSYHHDSDIVLPYARFQRLEPGDYIPLPSTNFMKGKTKMAAWVVSNCNATHRNHLVERLEQLGVEVHVAGKCSKHWKNRFSCSDESCGEELRQFKFYFALENAFCDDYVTYKYYRNGLENNLVPIVLGGADYTDVRLTMPNSYINVQDFASIEQLATHIKTVANDEPLFNSYFKWRLEYKVVLYDWIQHLVCKLCTLSYEGKQLQSNVSAIYDTEKCSNRNSSLKTLLGKESARFLRHHYGDDHPHDDHLHDDHLHGDLNAEYDGYKASWQLDIHT